MESVVAGKRSGLNGFLHFGIYIYIYIYIYILVGLDIHQEMGSSGIAFYKLSLSNTERQCTSFSYASVRSAPMHVHSKQ